MTWITETDEFKFGKQGEKIIGRWLIGNPGPREIQRMIEIEPKAARTLAQGLPPDPTKGVRQGHLW